MGHSSTVRGIDWCVDSSVVQSYSADLELLYWNARTGKQVRPSKAVLLVVVLLDPSSVCF
jgi:WD40 repeat protein